MKRPTAVLIICCATAVLVSACATKKFVREQVGATETKLAQRVDTQEGELRQTAERTGANAQALDATKQDLDAAKQRLQGVDSQLGEVSALAKDAKSEAGTVGEALRETDSRLTQRFANRNKLSALETKSIYFDFNKAELRDEGMSELEEVAKALKADPNAEVELQGFADSRGADQYNYRLTRERVDAVVRYLVQRHGIELRRLHAVGMGKETRAAGTPASKDALAKSRRVDIVLLAPQS
jgi:outer membrane protein OmpA-like peptidoglycan-associated protein